MMCSSTSRTARAVATRRTTKASRSSSTSLPGARARKPRTSASSDRSESDGAAGTLVPAASSRMRPRSDAAALDDADPLARFVDEFVIDDPSLVDLDGNSLGRLPTRPVERVRAGVEHEWGAGLVGSWDHWVDMATEVGDALGTSMLGAEPGETLVAESTTVNLFKLLSAAVADRPGHIVCDP